MVNNHQRCSSLGYFYKKIYTKKLQHKRYSISFSTSRISFICRMRLINFTSDQSTAKF